MPSSCIKTTFAIIICCCSNVCILTTPQLGLKIYIILNRQKVATNKVTCYPPLYPFIRNTLKKILCLSLSAMGKPIVWVIQGSIKLDKANAEIHQFSEILSDPIFTNLGCNCKYDLQVSFPKMFEKKLLSHFMAEINTKNILSSVRSTLNHYCPILVPF